MGFLEERDLSNVPTIPEFYKGKTIFITGGSGFIGKVLIEILLYSCSELDRIYLLMRSKRCVKPEERLRELYSSLCFDRLRREKPGIFERKVSVVSGDVMRDGLGLTEEDRSLLINKVNVIFHVAASVRFDDSLAYAANMNLKGTKYIVELALEVKNLLALVHVSTSYANTNRDPIEEVMYPPHADWRDTLQICDDVDEQTLRVVTPKYLGKLPNTYTFTKQLAEHVVYEQRGRLPATIIRPSIVISSVYEPFPGWIENFNGPVGIMVACGKGIMRSIYSDPDLIPDYIPVDVCIKNMISIGWIRGTKILEPSDDVPIYNCCSHNLNNMTISELVEVGLRVAPILPLNDVLWNPGGSITTSKTEHFIKVLILHLLPAIFVDIILLILGRKPMLVKIQRRIYIANTALEYFVTQQLSFTNDNFLKLRSSIKEEDRKRFFYDVENVDKYEYFRMCVVGGKKFLLKERDEDLPKARAHYKKIVVLEKLVKCIFYGLLFWWLLNTSFIQNFGQSLKSLLC